MTRSNTQRLELPFACPCFSLAWARKDTARAADIGLARLFIVGIAVLVIDHDRFAAWMDDAAISAEQRIVTSVFRILISAMLAAALFRGRFCLSFKIFTFLRGLLRAPLKGRARGLRACRRGHKQTSFKTQSRR
jgi:hypothetical protein